MERHEKKNEFIHKLYIITHTMTTILKVYILYVLNKRLKFLCFSNNKKVI